MSSTVAQRLMQYAAERGLDWTITHGSNPENPGEPLAFHLVAQNGKPQSWQVIGETEEGSENTISLAAASKPKRKAQKPKLPTFQKYDVLQVNRGTEYGARYGSKDGWLDYSTLRDIEDFDRAIRIVDSSGTTIGDSAPFRVVRPGPGYPTIYEKKKKK